MDTDNLYFSSTRTGDIETIANLTDARRVAITYFRTCVQAKATAIEGSVCISDCGSHFVFNENNWSTLITQNVKISMDEGIKSRA